MTRILVQRGSASNNQSRPAGSSSSGTSTLVPQVQAVNVTRDEQEEEVLEIGSLDDDSPDSCLSFEEKTMKRDELFGESNPFVVSETVFDDEKEKVGSDEGLDSGIAMKELGGLRIREKVDENEGPSIVTSQIITGSSQPPPPPVPPPKPSGGNLSSRRTVSGGSNAVRIGPSRRAAAWPLVSARNAQSDSRPSSPRSYGEGEGYNSADEQSPCFGSTCDDAVEMVIIPATTGQMGVLPGHVATIAELKPRDIVVVEAVPLDQIDASQVQKGLAEFNQKLSSASTDLEKAEAQIGVEVDSALNFALSG